ncbi:MAG TPA: sigma-54 dependent transcriptional regulator [Gemmatimonadaceae bacterium]|nr:sigma-54 dependent transcriptional regulator [Gemmatimonadaceae bacterium]
MRVLLTLTDVEPAVRINAALEQSGAETDVVSPLDDVRAAVRRFKPDVFVLSGALLDAQNVALVREALWDGVPVVGLSDVGDDAMTSRLRIMGYSEVYTKPVSPGDVVAGIRRLADRQALARLTGLYGESEAIREVLVRVEQMAPVSSTVLVEGESGTGKELVARAMHVLGPRRGKPFIAVNVGALPDTLVESELFGHEKGAFTGAAERRIGRFELADTGTLFLDEVGEIAPATQVKLLRVLEERELTRVGGTQPIRVDVRVVAATNQSLRDAVEQGAFRSDLYYRLNVLSIYLPPLRERKADIPILVRRFIQEFSAQHDRPFHGISAEALQLLVDYPWPGNVRELRNLVESMVVLAPGHEIGPADIPRQIREGAGRLLPVPMSAMVRGGRDGGGVDGREMELVIRSLVDLKLQVEELRRRIDEERVGGGGGGWIGEPARELRSGPGLGAGAIGIEPPGAAAPPNVVTITPGMTMAAIERAAIEAALKETRGNRRKAAEMLGIGERTLYRKLREYQIPDPTAVDATGVLD